jgi:hypothetical protein
MLDHPFAGQSLGFGDLVEVHRSGHEIPAFIEN